MSEPQQTKLPTLDPKAVKALDEMFPERSAELQWTEKEVWFKAGQRQVVRVLLEHLRRQTENILNKEK